MAGDQQFVERVFHRYAKPEFLSSDPVGLVHDFPDSADREAAALLCALFAYGGVKAMRSFLASLLNLLIEIGGSPARGLHKIKNLKFRPGLYYRFQSADDVSSFLSAASALMPEKRGSIWAEYFGKPGEPMEERIDSFQKALLDGVPRRKRTAGLIHLTGRGSGTGARKRFCMYLRWMVRSNFPDLGLYRNFTTSELVVPLDVHMLRLAHHMRWTDRKTADWKTAVEVTNALRRFDADDPLRFDFALTRIGILRERKILSEAPP